MIHLALSIYAFIFLAGLAACAVMGILGVLLRIDERIALWRTQRATVTVSPIPQAPKTKPFKVTPRKDKTRCVCGDSVICTCGTCMCCIHMYLENKHA